MEIAPMDFAMGLKVMRRMMNRNVKLGVLGAITLGAGSLFAGGCANQQEDQIAQLNSEIASLKEEKAQLEQARIAAETRANEAATKQTAAQAPGNGNGAGWDDPSGTGGGNRPRPQQDVVITVAGDVLFASGQVTLKPDAKTELDRVARQLNGQYAGHNIRIEGYTDSDPIRKSKFPSNEALSQARAEAVERYLVSKGVSQGRVSSVGRGAAKPKATKAASRRVEIVVLGQ
jgi:flagellar motor protein MotB